MSKSNPIPMAEMEDTSFIQNNEPHNEPEALTGVHQRSSCVKIAVCIVLTVCIVAALLGICIWIFFLSGDPRDLAGLLFGSNKPALEFRPTPLKNDDTLIWYDGSKFESYKELTNNLDEFLQPYKQPDSNNANLYHCDYNHPPQIGQSCDFDIKAFQKCTKENSYGYNRGSPCIFLRMNQLIDWTPDFYNKTNDLPEKMPEYLKELITYRERQNHYNRMNAIWVSCEGENPADKENIGPINFFPESAFPGYYFPFTKQAGYLSPLVAINFERPTRGVIINVECRTWARNIQYDDKQKIGSVHFELLID